MATVAFVAMFLTDNEAGVAAALLLSGVLLIVGIQGTQVGRLSKDEAGFMAIEEAERQKVAEAITTVASAGDPVAAGEILDAYESENPEVRKSPSISKARSFTSDAIDYEHALMTTLSSLGLGEVITTQVRIPGTPVRVDGVIDFPDGVKIVVEAKHYSMYRALPYEAVAQVLSYVGGLGVDGALLITDGAVSPWARETIGDSPVEVVQWLGPGDNEKLRQAVLGLLNKVKPKK